MNDDKRPRTSTGQITTTPSAATLVDLLGGYQVRGGTEAVNSCAIVLKYEPTQFELWCKRFEPVLYEYASWFMGARVEGNKYIVYTTSKQRAERDLDKLPEFSDWRDHVRLVRQGKIIPL